MKHGRADDLRMGHHNHRPTCVLPTHVIQVRDDTCLRLGHALPARRVASPALAVPTLPFGIVGELVKRASGPRSEIDLVERGANLHTKAEATAHGAGGLACAL